MIAATNCIRCMGTGQAPTSKWDETEDCDCVERREQSIRNRASVDYYGLDDNSAGETIAGRLRSEAEDLRRQSERVDSAYMLSGAFRCDEAAVTIDELTEALISLSGLYASLAEIIGLSQAEVAEHLAASDAALAKARGVA